MQTQTDYRFEKWVNMTFLVLFIICLAGAAWLTLTNVSPALELNILQAYLLDGDYFPVLTILILVFPFIIIGALIKTILVFIFNKLMVKEGEPKIPYGYKVRWK